MSENAWVTLATNDSYSLGALVLAHSLRQVGTSHRLVCIVTPGISDSMREKLSSVFDIIFEVNLLDSKDEANLMLMQRPELGITFTKLHCWRLTQFKKCVFLDADTLVLQNCDELFDREEFSAAPDVGWPDCFNSGVFVYQPSEETYTKLIKFALENRSFDGGDQGLLNLYFSDWAHKDISKHLPFLYNMCSTACYSYLPAFKQFGEGVKIIHFIGITKPWLQYFNTETMQVNVGPGMEHLQPIVQFWWQLFCTHVHSVLSYNMGGLAGALAQITLGQARSATQSAFEDHMRRQSWEVGNIDYMGRDRFENIWSKISETLATAPTPPKPEPVQTRRKSPSPKPKQVPVTKEPKQQPMPAPEPAKPITAPEPATPAQAPPQEQPVPVPQQVQPVPVLQQVQPVPVPQQEQPVLAPQQQKPVQAPQQEQPVPVPQQQKPVQPPQPEKPVQTPQPVIPAPAPQPVIPAPAPQPVIPAPAPQPVIAAPAPQPVIPAPAPQPAKPVPAPQPAKPVPAPQPEQPEPVQQKKPTPQPEKLAAVVEKPTEKQVAQKPVEKPAQPQQKTAPPVPEQKEPAPKSAPEAQKPAAPSDKASPTSTKKAPPSKKAAEAPKEPPKSSEAPKPSVKIPQTKVASPDSPTTPTGAAGAAGPAAGSPTTPTPPPRKAPQATKKAPKKK